MHKETKYEKSGKIIVRGARTHNLKNITVEMPRDKMVVFTGLSGSGKSSLAFDTIFAEGQRRYIESLSSYARQFLRQFQKPDVDEIIGLSPAISIDQKSHSSNPRSTVATITEIYDYMRVLFARIGRPHCLICSQEIKRLSNDEIVDFIMNKLKRHNLDDKSKTDQVSRVMIFAPVVRGRKGEYYQLLYDLLGKGYTQVKIDGTIYKLREQIVLDKNKRHDVDVLIDEISLVERDGLASAITNKEKIIRDRLAEAIGIALAQSDDTLRVVFNMDQGRVVLSGLGPKWEEIGMSAKYTCPNDGFSFMEVEPRLFSFNSPFGACEVCHGLGTKTLFGDEPCDACQGKRLRPEALNVFIAAKNIVDLSSMSIKDAFIFFKELKLTEREIGISSVVTKEIQNRIKFMLDVGLDYLSLDRRAGTLSGGEAQRIRLASQLGSRLVGALYVLDEPTIGLHSRDNDRLIKTLKDLRDLGNTIIVVEHDEDTIFASDYLVDIGPGAGVHGGEIVVSGPTDELITNRKNKSLTLDYLRGDTRIELPKKRRDKEMGSLKIIGGNIFNIKNLNIDVPLGKLICLTGVSGSGKSSLMDEIIFRNLHNRFERRRKALPENCTNFLGAEYVSRIVSIDQSPIGRTPRSNPATYTGAFTHIRDMFAETVDAKVKGFRSNRFSFNVKGGRCETCEGNGQIAVEMLFLPTVYVPCDVCSGKRFNRETLDVKYKKKSIHDVLKMTVEEAGRFFAEIPAIYDRLKILNEVGLGYLELGQSATTLSGGESQRVKIASELYRPGLHKTVYLLDEPTIGLHYEDVKNLVEILQRLVVHGNTVIVIEHNMDVIKSADYIIDMGPEGGVNGGQVIAHGTPEAVTKVARSYTGQYLKKVLKRK
ncbi:MAG: excinuclease ABC subunit UvrA [Candidatus Vogelbacteria bacterium]|nr:excinuclease ABC subunit UvrA [Candidatus Vogelbacteria bacterium]